MKKVSIILLLIQISLSINAQSKIFDNIKPDHIKLQYAGNIGVISTGIGYSFFNNKIQSDLFYGYIPEFIGGANIHTISNKNTFKLIQFPFINKISLTHSIGFSIIYSKTNNTFFLLPKQYPENYYQQNALNFSPFFSYSLSPINYNNDKILNKISLYFEISTIDKFLWYYFKTAAINFTELWNLAIGITIHIK